MKQFKEMIEQFHMLEDCESLYIALSGGADSMALAHMLKGYISDLDLNINLKAIHIHHGLRPTSDNEAVLVNEWCHQWQIPCDTIKVDVKEKQSQGYTIEEAARICRYEVFEGYINNKGVRIALAHHRDDQAETVLMNLFRGSGLKGLGGILPVRGIYIRPLLNVSKEAILAYCFRNEIPFVHDESNDSIEYRRNLLRNEIIPYINDALGMDIRGTIEQSATLLQQDEAYLESVAREQFDKYVETISSSEREGSNSDGKGIAEASIKTLFIKAMDRAIAFRVLRQMVSVVKGNQKNITGTHVRNMFDLVWMGTGKTIHLPDGVWAVRDYDDLKLIKHHKGLGLKGIGIEENSLNITFDLECLERKKFLENKGIRLRLLSIKASDEIPKKLYTKWFDYDRIRGNLKVRHRENGDFVRIKRSGVSEKSFGKKKLKDYFIDKKISREVRDCIPLLADDEEVLWIIGYRTNDGYRITDDTRRILEVEYTKEDFFK